MRRELQARSETGIPDDSQGWHPVPAARIDRGQSRVRGFQPRPTGTQRPTLSLRAMSGRSEWRASSSRDVTFAIDQPYIHSLVCPAASWPRPRRVGRGHSPPTLRAATTPGPLRGRPDRVTWQSFVPIPRVRPIGAIQPQDEELNRPPPRRIASGIQGGQRTSHIGRQYGTVPNGRKAHNVPTTTVVPSVGLRHDHKDGLTGLREFEAASDEASAQILRFWVNPSFRTTPQRPCDCRNRDPKRLGRYQHSVSETGRVQRSSQSQHGRRQVSLRRVRVPTCGTRGAVP